MGQTKEVIKENKMGTMPVTKLIFTMSLPAILSMTILAMYNVVDSIFIGNYSQKGLTAMSLVYPLQLVLISALTHLYRVSWAKSSLSRQIPRQLTD